MPSYSKPPISRSFGTLQTTHHTSRCSRFSHGEHGRTIKVHQPTYLCTCHNYKTPSNSPPAQSNLPKLSAQQHQKLLLLSLLPLSRSHTSLTYPALLSALDLPTTRALEELITTAIYAGLLTATLDPAHSLVSVTSVAPLRDLAPGSLPALQATLSTWSQRCDTALADLEARVAEVKKAAVDREKLRRKKERAVEVMVQSSEEKGGSQKRGVSGLGEDDMMDIDQESGSQRVTRGTKRGAGGFGNFGRRLG